MREATSAPTPEALQARFGLSRRRAEVLHLLAQGMDNKAIAQTLPPYSPDLNPIENAFSKIKQLLRSASHRVQKALWSDVQRMLNAITASDAEGYFKHCGYTLQF